VIVDPDFLDHWRTRMVVDALSDEMAPLCILRLWGHCQSRKSWRFEMPVRGLKSQCRFSGDAEAFEAALIDAGFLKRDGEFVEVLGWEEKNKSLIAAWDNGAKGGRPPKEPKQNPRVTETEPMDNPAVTQTEPSANPRETDKSREDKSREETTSLRSVAQRATRKCPKSFEVTEDLIAWAGEEAPSVDLKRETAKFRDHTFKSAHSDWDGAWRNWMRKATEFAPPRNAIRPSGETAYQRNMRERMEGFAPGIAARPPGQQRPLTVIQEVQDVPAIASR
jgi:hypothetical protein